MRDARRRSPNPSLLTYIESQEGPGLPQRLARDATLPNSDNYRDPSYHGMDPSELATSKLLCGTGCSGNDSLPGWTDSTRSEAPESIPSSMGWRELDRQWRGIVEDERGDMILYPPLRPDQTPILQCPFNLLECRREFHIDHFDQWLAHSLTHFESHGPNPRVFAPPVSNRSCFCAATFEDPDGYRCWEKRMEHVAFHHRCGESLSHARPDFALYEYLWCHRLISLEVYNDIKANSDERTRMIHGEPSPPASEDGDGGRPYIVMNERRCERRARRPES